ncbi:MAG: hypothetical protein JSV97_11790, partial [candidate division WOR-3 bacterium]
GLGGLIGVAEEKETPQAEPEIMLELVWEKRFDGGIFDVGFNKDREQLYPTWIIEGSFYDAKAIYAINDQGEISFAKGLKKLSAARISRNGEFVGVLEPDSFTKKEAEPVGSVKIYSEQGNVVHKTNQCWGYWFWVSPYGDEIIMTTPWVHYWFYSSLTDKEVYLDKTLDTKYFFGNNLKIIAWRNSKDVPNLVSVYDTTVESHIKGFAIPSASYGYTNYNYFLLPLPEVHKFALSVKNGFIKLYNGNGKLEKIIDYPVDGRAIFCSQNNRSFHIPLKGTHILYDIESGTEILRTEIFPSHAVVTNNAEFLVLKEDSLYLVSQKEVLGSKFNILQKKNGEERILLKTNQAGDKLCIITNYRIVIVDILRK